MKKTFTVSMLFAALALAVTGRVAATANTPPTRADQVRNVYFSAVDAKGAAVTDLTAADLAVKEGGKDRAITSVEKATAPMQIAVLVDDQGQGYFQSGLLAFMNATLGHAQYAISILNPQPQKLANYIEDVEGLKAALAKLGQRSHVTPDSEQIIEAVAETAKELRQRKAERPVIVVLSVSGEKALSDRADPALTDLKSSGAQLNVVYLTGIELGKMLGDGPKQSGGLIEQAATGAAISPALSRMADALMHQYLLTYTIPDGTKLNEKLQLTTTRKGITLRAPSRIPDK